jgi:hypothetical protein
MRNKYVNETTLFLHLCDYPPFEKDLTLLNKLAFMQEWFAPSLIEIDQMILSNIQM